MSCIHTVCSVYQSPRISESGLHWHELVFSSPLFDLFPRYKNIYISRTNALQSQKNTHVLCAAPFTFSSGGLIDYCITSHNRIFLRFPPASSSTPPDDAISYLRFAIRTRRFFLSPFLFSLKHVDKKDQLRCCRWLCRRSKFLMIECNAAKLGIERVRVINTYTRHERTFVHASFFFFQ